jgi:hypothetical protein
VVGSPIPRISEKSPTNTSIRNSTPPDNCSTSPASSVPMGVRVTVATMIPAAAVATPMPIMLRAPEISPSTRSAAPPASSRPKAPLWPRNIALIGRWVRMMNSITATA